MLGLVKVSFKNMPSRRVFQLYQRAAGRSQRWRARNPIYYRPAMRSPLWNRYATAQRRSRQYRRYRLRR